MKTMALFLVLTSGAIAQQSAWTSQSDGWCSMGGPLWRARNGICYAADAKGMTSGIIYSMVPTDNMASVGHCDADRVMVMQMDGAYACARDVVPITR